MSRMSLDEDLLVLECAQRGFIAGSGEDVAALGAVALGFADAPSLLELAEYGPGRGVGEVCRSSYGECVGADGRPFQQRLDHEPKVLDGWPRHCSQHIASSYLGYWQVAARRNAGSIDRAMRRCPGTLAPGTLASGRGRPTEAWAQCRQRGFVRARGLRECRSRSVVAGWPASAWLEEEQPREERAGA